MKTVKKLFTAATVISVIILLYSLSGCGKKLPENRYIGNKSYHLVNQDSNEVTFPDDFRGKIVLMSFIYTHCPDICPLTTHNMQLIQARVKNYGIKNVEFIELTFDPDRDTPSILREYGDIRSVDYSNFQFLTGQKTVIDKLLKHMNVIALPGDTTETESGAKVYFFTHNDRITLLDGESRIRNEYMGSNANIEEVLRDIKKLGD